MKPVIVFAVLYFFLFQGRAGGQAVYYTNRDSLEYFYQKRDLLSYFNKVFKLSNIAADTLIDQGKLDSIGIYLFKEFGSLTLKERSALRSSAMIVASKYNRRFGNYDKALKLYLLAHQNVEDVYLLDKYSWYVENEILNIYTRKADYEKADFYANLVEKSLLYLIKTDTPSLPYLQKLSRFYSNRALQYQSEGKVDEAFKYFNKGFILSDSIKFPSGIFPNALGLSDYFIGIKKYDEGKFYLEMLWNTIQLLKNTSNYKSLKADLLFQEATYNYEKGVDEKNILLIKKSIPLYTSSIDSLSEYYKFKKRREFAKYYISLAEAYIYLDSLKEAEYVINLGFSSIIADYNNFETPPVTSQIYHENSFVELFQLQSQLFMKQYNNFGDISFLERALHSIELGLMANDIITDEVIAEPSKLISIGINKKLTHDGLDITYALYSLNGENQYLKNARNLFNRSKALLLDEKIRKHRLMDHLSIEDSTRLAQFQHEIQELHSEKFVDGINLDSLNGLILVTQEQIEGIFGKYKEMHLQTEHQGDYIEYSIHDDDIFVLSLIQGEHQFLKLRPKNEFIGLLERMNEFVLLRGLSQDMTILKELYQFLIQPVKSELPPSINIIPDGEIGFVPFEILEDDKGRKLIEYCAISYGYEYETFKYGNRNVERKYEIYCLAPTYQDEKKKVEEVTRGSLYQLPYAKIEADSILNLFGSEALVSENGHKDSLVNRMKEALIFHFAGHAIVKKDEAYLVLNSSLGRQEQLSDQEISLISQSSELVVLSACETGLGKLELGEGIRSLGRSFIEGGASATIISLWNVNDQSTSMIMTAFYKFLLQGLTKDQALRNAKLEYISKVDMKYQHPYFWAAFIPAGNMNSLNLK